MILVFFTWGLPKINKKTDTINRKSHGFGNVQKGLRTWCQKVDVLTHRGDKINLYSLDKDFVYSLNTQFGKLRNDDNYIKH